MKKKKGVDIKRSQNAFTAKEIAFLKTLNTPAKIQGFLDTFKYNKGRRLSIADVFRQQKGDCIESAMFASYVFRLNGIDTVLVDLYCFDDDDHVICVYKKRGLYGSVAQSLYLGLRNKSPIYRTLRELALSYFEHFFNYHGELDLRMYSSPVRLPKKDGAWLFSKKFMYAFEKKIDGVKHYHLVPKNITLAKVSTTMFEREFIQLPKEAKIAKAYVRAAKSIKRI